MHMMFSEEELYWVNTQVFGWPIKNGCPRKIKQSIERKKKMIDNQEVTKNGIREPQSRSAGSHSGGN